MITKFRKLVWTEHSQIKMRQYGLSKQKLLGILYKPERKEKGIAPGTTAVMRTNPTSLSARLKLRGASKTDPKWRPKRAPGEIWLMYKDVKMAMVPIRRIISAWRYPGISKPGEAIPIPDEIRQELLNEVE
jgi:hypothetical protein